MTSAVGLQFFSLLLPYHALCKTPKLNGNGKLPRSAERKISPRRRHMPPTGRSANEREGTLALLPSSPPLRIPNLLRHIIRIPGRVPRVRHKAGGFRCSKAPPDLLASCEIVRLVGVVGPIRTKHYRFDVRFGDTPKLTRGVRLATPNAREQKRSAKRRGKTRGGEK